MPSKSSLRVGVLVTDPVQLLDMSSVDLLGMATPEYLSLQDCTANVAIRVTHTIEDPVVTPGSLDLLIIPGPDPKLVPSEGVQDFVRKHAEFKTTIFVICTGVFYAGHCGLLKGKHVTGPRALIPDLQKKFPDAAQWDSSMRAVHDGNMWTCGGITNGNDLVATWMKENYPGPVAEVVCAMAEVGGRWLKYQIGQTRSMMFFVW